MDPIHPIVPVPPSIPSVTPAPMAGRVDRDGSRGNPDSDPHPRRRRSGRGPESAPAAYVSEDGREYYDEAPEDDDDSGLHINVTA
ncbi:MAG TPA: hypothetical protein VMA77_21700 [Solirubrobacteraceae bacterium]|nr:hypothetical protein [Solirubrobacteraceae bacterium]